MKQRVLDLLESPDFFDVGLKTLRKLPPRKVVRSLVGVLCSGDDVLKMRAVTALGTVVAEMAATDMESARTVMRRLMWSLNDESGGIGWGAPEAMGEIMARHDGLANEFAHILISYARQDGNFLEYEPLQRGLLWAIGRLAGARSELLKGDVTYIIPYLDSRDAVVRGLAVWSLGLVGAEEALSRIETLVDDENEIPLYLDGKMVTRRVRELAEGAINAIKG